MIKKIIIVSSITAALMTIYSIGFDYTFFFSFGVFLAKLTITLMLFGSIGLIYSIAKKKPKVA